MEASNSLLSPSTMPLSSIPTKIFRLDIFNPANVGRPVKDNCTEFIFSSLQILSLSNIDDQEAKAESTTSLVTRLSLLWRQGRIDEAHICLDSLLARKKQLSDWLTSRLMVVRGFLLKEQGKILPSLPCFHSAITLRPTCTAAFWGLATAFGLLGQGREKGEVLTALENLLRGGEAAEEEDFFHTVLDLLLPGKSPSLTSVMVARARFLVKEEMFEEGADKFLEVLAIGDDLAGGPETEEEIGVFQETVLALLRTGKGEEALAVIQHRATTYERRSKRGQTKQEEEELIDAFLLGRGHHLLGDHAKALDHFDGALQCCLYLNQHCEKEEKIARMDENDVGSRQKQLVDRLRARLCIEKSTCYLAVGDMKSCIDALRQALSLWPNLLVKQVALDLLVRNGKRIEARELEAVAVEEMDEMRNVEADSNVCVAFLLDISTFDAKVFP